MNQPQTGIYLDATLAIIAGRVEEQIDSLQRRRRRAWVAIVLSLILVTAVSGTAAASVLLAQRSAPAAPVLPALQFQCVTGSDVARPAYFGARIGSSSRVKPSQLAAACAAALPRVTAGGGSVKSLAADLLSATGVSDVRIESAYTGRVSAAYRSVVPPMAVCVRTADDARFVISATPRELAISASEWSRRCSLNAGFELSGVAQ